MSLFRPEAISALQTQSMGGIVLIRPVSFTYLTVFSLVIAASICCFLILGSYTKRSTVTGQLLPDGGLLKIFVPQSGVVIEKKVDEAQHVKAGDVLYVLSSERLSSRLGETQAAISKQVDQRLNSIREEIKKTQALHLEERNGLGKKISALQNELWQLNSQIEGQRSRVSLSQMTVNRYQSLLDKDYISIEQLQQKQEDLLDQQARLKSLERDRISIGRELSNQQTELKNLPLKQQNQITQLDRALSNANQELTESEARRRLIITAPQSGTVTAVMAELGQTVDSNHSLVTIVPENVSLHANLYAPSRAIGFIKPGNKVLIRYQAYPYEKFGHHEGIVETVSKTALPANEMNALGSVISGNNSSNEHLYRITVKLAEQSIKVYGKLQDLQAGMLIDADILQEKRRLYEWVLEPLYSLTGKF